MSNLQMIDLFNNLLENYLYSNSFIFSTFFLKVSVFLSPEIFLILAILIYLCIIKNFNNFYINSLFFLFVLTVEFFFIFFNFMYTIYFGKVMPELFFSSCFIFDTYSNFCKFIIVLFLLIIIIFSEHKYVWHKPFGSCVYIPIFFLLFFSLFLLSSFDLFTAYLSLEGVSLSLYILAANSYQKRVAIEATIKYFVFGGVSNGILLFGNSIIFSLCGSLNYTEVKYLLNSLYFNLSSIEVSFSLICFLLVFFFKVAAFPCHM
jgi:NADH-quinone oxidoreductase subunit N